MGNRGKLARVQEQRLATQRQHELARQEVQRYYQQQRLMDSAATAFERQEPRRQERQALQAAYEQAAEERHAQAAREAQAGAIVRGEAAALAQGLAQQLTWQQARAKQAQRLREQSAELRKLAEQIRLARVQKERALQLQEKAVLAAQEQEYDSKFDEVLMRLDAAGLEQHRAADAARRTAGRQQLRVLEQQMEERSELQRQAEEHHQREKAMVDEVIHRIQEEDRLEAEKRRTKQEETKAYIAQFLADSVTTRAAKRAADAAEERRIEEYWQQVRQREAVHAGAKAERQRAADRIYEQLKLEQERQLKAKEEEQHLIDLMREEDVAERRRVVAAAAAARREASKREMLAANELQLRLKAEREAAAAAEEARFASAMMAKFAEDDRIEQMNAHKRRMRVAEHKREVDSLVAERRAMFEAQRAAEEAADAARREEAARDADIIASERRRLLEEAADVLEFLPPRLARDAAAVAVPAAAMATSG